MNRNTRIIDHTAVSVPPNLPEQAFMVVILADVGEEFATVEGKIAKVGHIEQGMLQELLAGRIRLI